MMAEKFRNVLVTRARPLPWTRYAKRFALVALALLAPASPAPDWIADFEWRAGQHFDKRRWTFETGFLRNEEQQYYTGGNPKNFEVTPEGLRFIGRREVVPNAAFRPGSRYWITARPAANYTSTSIVSKQAWRDFRVEVVANVNGGKGAWPAIWLRGANATGFSEVDLMEQLGREPDLVHATMHFGATLESRKSMSTDRMILGLQGRDVTYAAELSPRQVAIFVNDRRMLWIDRTIAAGATHPFDQSFNLIVNLALGSAWAGPVDEAGLPALMIIKSIRVLRWRHQSKVAAAAKVATK